MPTIHSMDHSHSLSLFTLLFLSAALSLLQCRVSRVGQVDPPIPGDSDWGKQCFFPSAF